MPNRQTHLDAGRRVRRLINLTRKPLSPRNEALEDLGSRAALPVLSRLPDIFEPPTSPHHRGPAHSVAALGLALLGSTQANKPAEQLHELGTKAGRRADVAGSPTEALGWRALDIACHLAAGVVRHAPSQYATHLMLDSRTPKGLPW